MRKNLPRAAFLRRTLLPGLAACALAGTALRAGSVVTLTDSPESDGKVSVKGDSIHVDSSSPTDSSLGSVLAANFGDAFVLNYFSSDTDASSQLPAGWKAQDEGTMKAPGAAAYANGAFTLSGTGMEEKRKEEETNCTFAGMPWVGDGQWTARVTIDPALPYADAGLMLRESLDATAPAACLAATADINSRQFDGAGVRYLTDDAPLRIDVNPPVSVQMPVWLRLIRSGENLEGDISQDGVSWQILYENGTKMATSAWMGLFVSLHHNPQAAARGAPAVIPGGAIGGNPPPAAPAPAPAPPADDDDVPEASGKATLDHISFAPGPCSVQVIPAGVTLQSGSFLAGAFDRLDIDAAKPTGVFRLNGKTVAVPSASIAVVTLHPTDRGRINQAAGQAGLIMKNGDLLVGDTQAIDRSGVTANSLLLGITPYKLNEVLACILRPVLPVTAPYEIRLYDGSDILASGVTGSKGDVVIREISGLSLSVDAADVAQFRAGPAQVQNLLEVPWQVPAPPPGAASPAPAASTNAPGAAPASEPTPEQRNAAVLCWEGTSEEHIMAVPAQTVVNFPLTGKFRAVALSVALAPDAAPNVEAVLRILADGQEVARTPAIRVGDAPRYMQIAVRDPRTVTIVANSAASTRTLLIDPVAIRDD